MLLFTRCFRVAVVLPVYMFHQIAKMSAVLSFKRSLSIQFMTETRADFVCTRVVLIQARGV